MDGVFAQIAGVGKRVCADMGEKSDAKGATYTLNKCVEKSAGTRQLLQVYIQN